MSVTIHLQPSADFLTKQAHQAIRNSRSALLPHSANSVDKVSPHEARTPRDPANPCLRDLWHSVDCQRSKHRQRFHPLPCNSSGMPGASRRPRRSSAHYGHTLRRDYLAHRTNKARTETRLGLARYTPRDCESFSNAQPLLWVGPGVAPIRGQWLSTWDYQSVVQRSRLLSRGPPVSRELRCPSPYD